MESAKNEPDSVEKTFFDEPGRLWTGQDLTRKTIVIVGNERPESQFMFSRYTRELKRLKPKVIGFVCSSPRMVDLFRTLPMINRVDSKRFDPFDYFIPVDLLPHRFSGIEIPETPYFRISEQSALAQRARMNRGKPLLGICWRASRGRNQMSIKDADVAKSIHLDDLGTLLNALSPHFDIVSLQEDLYQSEATRLANYQVRAENLKELSYQTISEILSGLDSILTVDSPVAHLAGALGLPCNVLLPYSSDWVWNSAKRTTPWYPGMQLFRQRAENNWAGTFPGLIKTLRLEAAKAGQYNQVRQAG